MAAIAVAGVLALVASRDDATPASIGPQPPGRAEPARAEPTEDTRLLAQGNVVLYASASQLAGARDIAHAMTGPASQGLRDAGLAIVVHGVGGPDGITARAHRRVLRARRADDPQLRQFVEYWLGRAPG